MNYGLPIDQVPVFKALADENRIKILHLLQDGEKCACELLEKLSISQSTLSHHMRILRSCHLVFGRKQGKWMHYTINRERTSEIILNLQLLLDTKISKNLSNSCCK